MAKQSNNSSFLVKILVAISTITVCCWLVLFVVGREFLKQSIRNEFSNSTTKIMKSVAAQTANEIKYGDYFQIRRILHDFYDESYMKYFAVYTADLKSLTMFPNQIDGEDYAFMEQKLAQNVDAGVVQEFITRGSKPFFHFQIQIKDENNEPIGFVVMGGRTTTLERALRSQTIFFILFVLVVLFVQTGIIIYFSYVLTRPLSQFTDLIEKTEGDEPQKFLPTILNLKPPKGASREIALFFSVYQKLIQNIHSHVLHEKELAVQASIGKIVSHIAHDMRSPISVLKGYLKTIKVDENNQDDSDYKAVSIRSVDKLNHMADDLVDFASAKQIRPGQVSICRLVREVAAEFSSEIKSKNASIEIDCCDDTKARLDEHKVNRVLVNLVQNACHALPAHGGKISIEVRENKNEWLTILIKDTGVGIKPEHLSHLFDSSFTFGKPKGTGLGLSYCKNVIDAHGGKISVESKFGEGSSFLIEIPQAILPLGDRSESPEEMGIKGVDGAKTILVVDDDQGILVQWKDIISKRTSYSVVTAASPDDAEKLDLNPTEIAAAIVDYHYEGNNKNGLDLARYLKGKNIPIVYLCTAYYYDEDLNKQAKAIGVHAVIPKPIQDGIIEQLFGSNII